MTPVHLFELQLGAAERCVIELRTSVPPRLEEVQALVAMCSGKELMTRMSRWGAGAQCPVKLRRRARYCLTKRTAHVPRGLHMCCGRAAARAKRIAEAKSLTPVRQKILVEATQQAERLQSLFELVHDMGVREVGDQRARRQVSTPLDSRSSTLRTGDVSVSRSPSSWMKRFCSVPT